MRRKLVAGNWKMHKTLSEARELVAGIRAGLGNLPRATHVDVLICPPVQLLFPMAKAVAGSPIALGAQNAHFATHGAFTGEVSVPMIKDTGATHVIIGHSERRQYFGEHGELLGKKVQAVLDGGLTVIYCIGETLDEREAGRTESVLERHLSEAITADLDRSRTIIAYEPVWAIGTGRTATPEQAQQAHAFIRRWLGERFGPAGAGEMRILYGGSVKPANAASLMAQPDIDGALVGGACLQADDFLGIVAGAVNDSN